MPTHLVAIGSILVVSALAPADAVWHGTVPPGQTTPLNIRVSVTNSLIGTSIDSDQASPPFSAVIHARFTPEVPPFQSMRIIQMSLNFGVGDYHFDFFCQSPFGCQPIDTNVTSVTHVLANPMTVDLTDGAFSVTTPFEVGYLATSTGVANASYDLSGTIPITLSGIVESERSVTRIVGLSMSEYVFEVPLSAMPPEVSATNYIRPLFTAANRVVGAISVVDAADLDENGSVDGADLTLLFIEWGTVGTRGDINTDGFVDGLDLGLLLTAWD